MLTPLGLNSIGKSGTPLKGDVLVAAGANVTITQSGQTLTFAASGGGGGSGDMLGTLVNTEISVTGAVTATIGTMHHCSDAGSPADYTVTLPAVSGNAGKLIGFRIDGAMTKLVTLHGHIAENIDGQNTRIMWAGESAELLCDGTAWQKVSGKSRPMSIKLTRQSSDLTSIPNGGASWTLVGMDTQDTAFLCPAAMWDSGNGRAKVLRGGLYSISEFLYATNALGYFYIGYSINAAQIGVYQQSTPAGDLGNAPGTMVTQVQVSVGDNFQPAAYGGSNGTITVYGATAPATFIATEVPQW